MLSEFLSNHLFEGSRGRGLAVLAVLLVFAFGIALRYILLFAIQKALRSKLKKPFLLAVAGSLSWILIAWFWWEALDEISGLPPKFIVRTELVLKAIASFQFIVLGYRLSGWLSHS